jgi:hypothetical protein
MVLIFLKRINVSPFSYLPALRAARQPAPIGAIVHRSEQAPAAIVHNNPAILKSCHPVPNQS